MLRAHCIPSLKKWRGATGLKPNGKPPNPEDQGVWIHQDAWFHLGRLEGGKSLQYNLHKSENGVYVFVIKGEATVNGQALEKRDGYGLRDLESLDLSTTQGTEVLIMEIPLQQ